MTRRISGGNSRNRLRKLFVVEEFIQRHVGPTLVFDFEAPINLAELSALGVFLDLLIPFPGMTLAQMPHELEELFARQLRDRVFDFLNLCHACSLASMGSHSQAALAGPRSRERGSTGTLFTAN